ncbi:MAG: hypothetical protein ACFFCW_47315 [Candidatus Hodarchaeota archaeon]
MKEEVETLTNALRQFIEDVERGKAVEEAGWMETEHGLELLLKKLGLYEGGAKGIRVSLRNPLPSELLRTEEGDIFSDMQLAVKIRELVPKIGRDQSLQTGAEICGFAYMLDASEFPVLSHRLFEEGFSSLDEWHTSASNATPLLTSLAAKKVWGVKRVEDALKSLHRSSLPALRIKKQGEGEGANRVRKTLKWDEVLEIVDGNTCKIMGFLWYVDYLAILAGIRYPESMMLIQERAWKTLEEITGKSIQEMRNTVIEDIERVEERTIDKGTDQDYAIASWHEILRLPW